MRTFLFKVQIYVYDIRNPTSATCHYTSSPELVSQLETFANVPRSLADISGGCHDSVTATC